MLTPEPFFQPRGTPFSVYHRAETLGKLGYEVDILTYPLGKDVKLENVNIYRIPKIPFIKHVKVGPSLTKLPLDFLLFIEAFVKLLSGKYDCIHSHEEAVFIASLLKIIFGKPSVYDMHSSLPQQLENFDFIRNKTIIRIAKVLERWALKISDITIVICPALRDTVRNIAPTKQVILIENVAGSDDCEVPPSVLKKIREELGIDSQPVILYAGTFEPYQGLDILIGGIPLVVRDYPQVRYVLAGGDPHQVEEMKRLAESLKVGDNVLFLGKRPPDDIPPLLAMADILVSPRKKGTNTPLKIYSYLRSGKPIVATDLSTHTQVLTKETAILTEPEANSFAQGIIDLLKDEELRKTIGRRGRELAETEYSYEMFVKKTELVYEYIEGLISKGYRENE